MHDKIHHLFIVTIKTLECKEFTFSVWITADAYSFMFVDSFSSVNLIEFNIFISECIPMLKEKFTKKENVSSFTHPQVVPRMYMVIFAIE